MPLVRLKYLNKWTDANRRTHIYFRRPGHKAIRLPSPVGSPEFMLAYNEALEATASLPKEPRVKVGTFASLALSYFNSAKFKGHRPETQRSQRGIINGLVAEHGNKSIAIRQDHIQAMVDAKAATPSAARNLLNVLRTLMDHAIDLKLRGDNPAIGVKRPRIKGKGFRSWKDEHCAKFEVKRPLRDTRSARI